jgi:DNA-binding NarL/FixJ family response regulator
VRVPIFIADDHQVVIDGVRAMLAGDPDFDVVGWTSDPTVIFPRAQELGAQLLILDLSMPQLGGLDVLKLLRQANAALRVVVMSMFADAPHASAAFAAGAHAFVSKQSSADDLRRAMREAIAGRRWIGPPLSDDILREYERSLAGRAVDPLDTLTSREHEILVLAARGFTNAQIGEQLGISKRTVETHRENLLRKLGLKSPSALVRFALQRKLIPEE